MHWGNLQEDVKAEVLGVEPGSSRGPRASAGPRLSKAKAVVKLKGFEANISSNLLRPRKRSKMESVGR
jgi:hypothetical protein